MKYTRPEVELMMLATADVITASGVIDNGGNGNGNELPDDEV